MGSEFGERGNGSRTIGQRDTQPEGLSKLELLQKSILAPFNHKKTDSTRILSDLAPVIMTPRMMNSATNASTRPRVSASGSSKLDFATLGRAPLRLGFGQSHRVTSRELQIVEATDELLQVEVPEPEGVASNVSLLRGFEATIPSAGKSRARRRQTRHVETPKLGLKRLGRTATGIMTEEEDNESRSVASEDDMVLVMGKGSKRKGRESLSTSKRLGKEELARQQIEIMRDRENLHVRQSLINSEIEEIVNKISALDNIRVKLEQDLLKLQEDELEFEDELQGVRERMEFEQSFSKASSGQSTQLPTTTRRRKGPAFLPSEHEELPLGVAFMTLESHTSSITALDFSEPYGTLVTASHEDAQPRVWDLFSGTEIGRLQGHIGGVKSIQAEEHICLTGGEDGNVRVWDLRKVDDEGWSDKEVIGLSDVAEEAEDDARNFGQLNGLRDSKFDESEAETGGSSLRTLGGHTRAVTALYFEDECLVTGASDKTLRQWDLRTGQCVMTMDILWAISHPPKSNSGPLPNTLFPGAAAAIGTFSVPAPPAADGSWDMYTDFVGGVQFWGYGLVSGSGDGVVRMWDMRTGQAHRTLHGHTGPVTCLQFDEIHIASGSLDKTIRIWDLRTGGTFETIKFEHAVTALQFDSRKIISAAGENGVQVYNRTSMQQSALITNGHTRPVERLRYMDRYLVTGGRDCAIKIWSL